MKQDELDDMDALGLESMLEVKLEVPLHDLVKKLRPVETDQMQGGSTTMTHHT